MARTDGQSPSQLFFGRRQKQQLPMISAQSSRGNRDLSGRDKTAAAAEKHRNAHTHDLGELQPGTKVRMQHHITNRWDKCVTVESRRPNGHAYTVRGENGKTYIRGRRLLKPFIEDTSSNTDISTPVPSVQDPVLVQDPQQKRKRGRPKKGEGKAKDIQSMPRRSPRFNEGITKVTVSRITIEYGGQQQQTTTAPARDHRGAPQPAAKPHQQHREQRISHVGAARSDHDHSSDSFDLCRDMGGNDMVGRHVANPQADQEGTEMERGDGSNGGGTAPTSNVPPPAPGQNGGGSFSPVVGDGRPSATRSMEDMAANQADIHGTGGDT